MYFSAISGKLLSYTRDIQTLCTEVSVYVHYNALISSEDMCLNLDAYWRTARTFYYSEFDLI